MAPAGETRYAQPEEKDDSPLDLLRLSKPPSVIPSLSRNLVFSVVPAQVGIQNKKPGFPPSRERQNKKTSRSLGMFSRRLFPLCGLLLRGCLLHNLLCFLFCWHFIFYLGFDAIGLPTTPTNFHKIGEVIFLKIYLTYILTD